MIKLKPSTKDIIKYCLVCKLNNSDSCKFKQTQVKLFEYSDITYLPNFKAEVFPKNT